MLDEFIFNILMEVQRPDGLMQFLRVVNNPLKDYEK
jgi:hypothetical protein